MLSILLTISVKHPAQVSLFFSDISHTCVSLLRLPLPYQQSTPYSRIDCPNIAITIGTHPLWADYYLIESSLSDTRIGEKPSLDCGLSLCAGRQHQKADEVGNRALHSSTEFVVLPFLRKHIRSNIYDK